jgi:glutaredoxin
MFRPTLALCLLTAAGSALAQYKVVAPDGSVTYTDRPPANTGARVTPLRRGAEGGAEGTDNALPPELRQAVGRYPVVLYAAERCAPCDTGRQFLQQRGIPYTERRVISEDDATAMERVVGGRTLPALTIGAQALRGMSTTDWTAYLDAAGYPRESKLPRNWQPPTPLPVTERTVAPLEPAQRAAAPQATPAPEQAPPAPGIRF